MTAMQWTRSICRDAATGQSLMIDQATRATA
jgi:hypothetical protein